MNDKSEQHLASKKLYVVRGIPIDIGFPKKHIEEIMDYVPRDNDVIIASYPKTGTTWLSYIVQQILHRGESLPSFENMLRQRVPFVEATGIEAVEALTTNPRVYKHHLPYDKVQKNPKSKYIYIYRNPADTFVSFYHFIKNMYENIDFDEFFDDFVKGEVAYGCYFQHVLSFLDHKSDENLLLVSYEKLQVRRKEEILRIAKFLGDGYLEAISADDEVVEKIIEHTSFDNMKKTLTPKDADAPKKLVNFFRKGVVGDGKMCLKEEQMKRLREIMSQKMNGTDELTEWLNFI